MTHPVDHVMINDWAPPPYSPSLQDVLPAVLASLGVPVSDPADAWSCPVIELSPAQAAVVVVIDGLGALQLARRSGHAPFLRRLEQPVPVLRSGFPSTTASSLASLGTGLSCGEHGIIGTTAPTPDLSRLFSHLSWQGGPDPAAYQPQPTLLGQATAAGVHVTTVSRPAFAESGLTRAALSGGAFRGARDAAQRVEATIGALQEHSGPVLVYLYLDEVDKTGHVHGPDSWQWGEAVEDADRTLCEIARRLPGRTSLTVTADHGMVLAPLQERYDLAQIPALRTGVHLLGGDPRAAHVFTQPGQDADVAARWAEILGEHAVVRSRAAAIEAGWFGPVSPHLAARIGDVVTAMTGGYTVLDAATSRPGFLALRGHHGSMTDAETMVPLLHLSA